MTTHRIQIPHRVLLVLIRDLWLINWSRNRVSMISESLKVRSRTDTGLLHQPIRCHRFLIQKYSIPMHSDTLTLVLQSFHFPHWTLNRCVFDVWSWVYNVCSSWGGDGVVVVGRNVYYVARDPKTLLTTQSLSQSLVIHTHITARQQQYNEHNTLHRLCFKLSTFVVVVCVMWAKSRYLSEDTSHW